MIQGWRRFSMVRTQRAHLGPINVNVIVPSEDATLHAVVSTETVELQGAYRRMGNWTSREMTAECPRPVIRSQRMLLNVENASHRAWLARQHLLNGECDCGIYVTKERRPGRGTFVEEHSVEAFVTGWGAFVEYGDNFNIEGWRFEHVRIEALFVDWYKGYTNEDERLLVSTFGVPVTVVNKPQPCCAYESEHGGRWVRRHSDGREVPICQLPNDQLDFMVSMYTLMGDNEFSARQLQMIASLKERRI